LLDNKIVLMNKIRRNQPCPCRSGRKYKHCCLPLQEAGLASGAAQKNIKISLLGEIKKIQEAARLEQETCRELGVFILFSTQAGDAWVLETTDQDAFQAAAAGMPLALPVNENADMIEVDWTHRFTLRDRQLIVTDYTQMTEEIELPDAPTMQIRAALRRIMKQYPVELLRQVHVRSESD
jgi:hypothetical protein